MFNHTSGVTAVTSTDRPKSVRNRCVIEVLVAYLYVAFWIFCGCRGFCQRAESDLILLLLIHIQSTYDNTNFVTYFKEKLIINMNISITNFKKTNNLYEHLKVTHF